MTFLSTFYTLMAFAQMALAMMIWQRSMPRLMEARGRGQAICAWLLGMALAINASISLSVPATEAGFLSLGLCRDVLLLSYGVCRYRWASVVSDATWRNFSLIKRGPR